MAKKQAAKEFKLTATAKERLDNFMVYSTIGVFALALFLVVLKNLSNNFQYILVVQGAQQGIMWLSLLGAAAFAVYSLVKKKLKLAGILGCLSLAVIMFGIYHVDGTLIRINGYGIAYIAMGLYLAFVYVYCWLKESGRFCKNQVRKGYTALSIVAALAVVIAIVIGYSAQLAAIRSYREGYTGGPLTAAVSSESDAQ